jgi:hypothetical protein
MLTSELRSKIDPDQNASCLVDIVNPIEVLEKITYLLCQPRQDDLHTVEEYKASRVVSAPPGHFKQDWPFRIGSQPPVVD